MNKFKLLVVAFLFQSFGLTLAYADVPNLQIQCYSVGSTRDFGYCIHKIKDSKSTDVLYYLHGAGSSEYEWQSLAALPKIYAAWGANAPAVISVSYGATWMLAEKNNSGYSGLFEHFTQNAMPWMEKYLGFTPTRRMIAGLSMGGFNASQLYLKKPGLFARAAFLCPAITSVSPYASSADIEAYVERTGASWAYVNRAMYLSQTYYPTSADWDKAAPVALASQVVTADSAPVFVSVGAQDQYGFQEGAKAFYDAIVAKGASAQWSLVQGGHCSFDVDAAVAFMTKP
jgi:pimeloyl-ACP methyl ester carboxylesterase